MLKAPAAQAAPMGSPAIQTKLWLFTVCCLWRLPFQGLQKGTAWQCHFRCALMLQAVFQFDIAPAWVVCSPAAPHMQRMVLQLATISGKRKQERSACAIRHHHRSTPEAAVYRKQRHCRHSMHCLSKSKIFNWQLAVLPVWRWVGGGGHEGASGGEACERVALYQRWRGQQGWQQAGPHSWPPQQPARSACTQS